MYLLPSPFSVRDIDPASDSDQSFVRALYHASRSDLLQMQADPAFIEHLVGMQQRMQEHGYRHGYPQARYLMIEKQAVPIGRLIISPAPNAWHVVDIALLPQAQGQGAGSIVLSGLQQHAAATHCSISLAVNKGNLAAHRLYERLGFACESGNDLQLHLRWSPA